MSKTVANLYTGRKFDLANPMIELVNIVDIAMSLSRINRFLGHTIRPYSVAQHSVLVAGMVAPELRLQALLHDAPEAYMGDITRPMRELIGPAIIERIEARIYQVIARKWHLAPVLHVDVKRADDAMLAKEQAAIQKGGTGELKIWHEDLAYARFMEAFEDYGGKDEFTT